MESKRSSKKKSPSSKFSKDIKNLKESFKISELLKNTKINSSFRIKAPKGTKVMAEDLMKDIGNAELVNVANSDSREESDYVNYPIVKIDAVNNVMNNCETEDDSDDEEQPQSIIFIPTTNTDACKSNEDLKSSEQNEMENIYSDSKENHSRSLENLDTLKSNYNPMESICEDGSDIPATLPRSKTETKQGNRKHSLDQSILSRNPSISQSEYALNVIGKEPLQRKSSILRKKFNSFMKNTSEVFKRQHSLILNRSDEERRASLSQSLLSFNDRFMQGTTNLETHPKYQGGGGFGSEIDRRETSLHSSNSSLNRYKNGSASNSTISLDELYNNELMPKNRAYSVSSGLDKEKPQRTQSSKTSRFSWLASDSVAEYLKRKIENHQESKEATAQDLHYSRSFQDVSSLKVDTTGRRLSYQRAVSGEYPTIARKINDGRKRSKNLEDVNAGHDVAVKLDEFNSKGIPPLRGFCVAEISNSASHFLTWCEVEDHLNSVYEWAKLSTREEARQSVIRELVNTEANYIRHLVTIVEVYIATAHALQDCGLMLNVETSRLFSNIPDVLNASLQFWEVAIHPMIIDAYENNTPYNPDLMWPGFCRFRSILQPYEKYVTEQSKCSDYLRYLSSCDAEFNAYLRWCSARNENKLQLSDIMVKPMQRLTKYALIIRRIITLTDCTVESAPLLSMETFAKNYVGDVNRTITQKQAYDRMDQLMAIVDSYELDFKDEEMDRLFRLHSGLNLHAPMTGCLPNHRRTILFEGALKYRDLKATPLDVYAILLTDMLLICKKVNSKSSKYLYKLIRPKFIINKMLHYPQTSCPKLGGEQSIYFVVTDEYSTSWTCFVISDPFKEPNPAYMKLWDQKIREAQLTFDMSYWLAQNPDRDLSDLDLDTDPFFCDKSYLKCNYEDSTIERDARETISTMLHKPFSPSAEGGPSQSLDTSTSSKLLEKLARPSTGDSSRVSRISSLQQSASAASNDEHQAAYDNTIYRCGSSVEHLITPNNPDDEPTSITVNVLGDSEPEVSPKQKMPPPPPPRTAPVRAPRINTRMLRVQPQCGVMALVHSLPDLSLEHLRHRESTSSNTAPPAATPMTASEKLYQQHQESLHRNRTATQMSQRPHSGSHLLSPNQRGTSYPPPTPTRTLSRSMAFSYTLKHPPLAKMGHVNSQSTNIAAGEMTPSTSAEPPQQHHGLKKSIDAATAQTTLKADKSGEKKAKSLGSSSSGWYAKSTEG